METRLQPEDRDPHHIFERDLHYLLGHNGYVTEVLQTNVSQL
jgi:hypothetical protein